MYVKKVEDFPIEMEDGERIRILLPKSVAENLEIREVHFPKGMADSLQSVIHSHTDEEQAYLILAGEGRLSIDGQETNVDRGTFIYIPRKVKHGMLATSEEELVYLLINSWVT